MVVLPFRPDQAGLALNFGPVLVGYRQQQGFGSVCEASRSVPPRSERLAVFSKSRQVANESF